MNCFTYLESPIGLLLLCCDGEARRDSIWIIPASRSMAAPGRRMRTRIRYPRQYGSCAIISRARRREFDLPLRLAGTDFQRRVWGGLTEIRYGETWSYGQLAKRIGNPKASRAVGLANGRNPISILVPCHRVIGADGSLTGYGGGLERKRWLLAHEGLQFSGGLRSSTAI